jgi:NADH-quinone oxidoreductase subunit H
VIALDPLLFDLDLTAILIVVLKVVVVFVIGLVATMLMVWFERKAIAGMQNRIGPDKAGPFGILQTLADGIKLFFKEDLIPERSDRFVFKLAPYLAFVPAFLVWTVIPLGGDYRDGKGGVVRWFGTTPRCSSPTRRSGSSSCSRSSSIAVYGVMLAAGRRVEVPAARLGACVGADGQLRGCARLSIASVLLISGTLSTSGIVAAQTTGPTGTSSRPGSCRSSSS